MERLFNLDFQLLFDAAVLALSVFVMFLFLSYFLFVPVRNVLKEREDRIKNDRKTAEQSKEEALKLKADYEAKIKNIEKEAQEILVKARQKALKKEEKILNEANKEAVRIRERAKIQIELERRKEADEKKKEMISIASLIAKKVMESSVTPEFQDQLVEKTLQEIGEQTWIS